MSSDSAVIESNSAFSLTACTPTYQATATPATHQVETSGVRKRSDTDAKRAGRAARRALDRPVRDAGARAAWGGAGAAPPPAASAPAGPPAAPSTGRCATPG